MNINVASLLNGNYILLLFVVLALGLCLGKLRLGSVQLGNSIGVLVVSLLLGQQHFAINTEALNLGFMLFIFCVGVEAGPNFSRFSSATAKLPDAGAGDGRLGDGARHRSRQAVPLGHRPDRRHAGWLDDFDAGAGGRRRHAAQHHRQRPGAAGGAGSSEPRLRPHLPDRSGQPDLRRALPAEAAAPGPVHLCPADCPRTRPGHRQPAQGLPAGDPRLPRRPRAGGLGRRQNLRELGIYRQTGCYIERIRRNGILANPDGDAVLQVGDGSRWSATRTPTRGWTRASATARKCSIAICSTCAS